LIRLTNSYRYEIKKETISQ